MMDFASENTIQCHRARKRNFKAIFVKNCPRGAMVLNMPRWYARSTTDKCALEAERCTRLSNEGGVAILQHGFDYGGGDGVGWGRKLLPSCTNICCTILLCGFPKGSPLDTITDSFYRIGEQPFVIKCLGFKW